MLLARLERGFKWRPVHVDGRQSSYREDAFYGGAVAAGAHEIRANLAAQQRAYGVDDNRLTRARLACEDIKKAMQAQMQGINNGEIFDI